VEPVGYLTALRRYWVVILAAVILAVSVAWFTRSVARGDPTPSSFQATTVLIASSEEQTFQDPGSLTDPNTVAALVTLNPIPGAVAESIGYEGDPEDLVAKVAAEVDERSGLLKISATDSDRERSIQIADAFATALLDQITALKALDEEVRIEELQAQVKRLAAQIRAAEEAEEDTRALDAEIRVTRTELRNLVTSPPAAGFRTVTEATAQPLVSAGFSAPRSFAGRALLAIALGAIAGIVLVLVLSRFDTRIRTRAGAERAYGKPVLAEIPRMRRWAKGRRQIIESPSRQAESFRFLAAELSRGDRGANGGAGEPPHSLLVTSAGPSEGKTMVVANLGVALSETGKRVLILSCDLHRPRVHHLFDLPNERGLAESLASDRDGPVLHGIVRDTAYPGLRVVTSGHLEASGVGVLSSPRMLEALREARAMADVVLIDTPPIFVASDAMYLVAEVDRVLVVVSAGRTRTDLASNTIEVLERLGGRVQGLVLNRSSETALPAGYRQYYRKRPPAVVTAEGGDSPDYRVTEGAGNV
jgi:capsular exopolysaccharide synthesis family protein